MKVRSPLRVAILAWAVLVLSSCGGGGGGGGGDGDPAPVDGIPPAPSTPIALNSKSHVLREVGNTVDVYAAFFNLDLGGSATLAERADIVVPKAAVTEPCELGGTRTTDAGSTTRTFVYFDVSDAVTFITEENDDCGENRLDGDGTRTTFNGHFEQGDTALGPDGDAYAYERYGSDPDRYSERDRNPDAPGDFHDRDAIGLTEFLLTPTRTEVRSVRESRYERGEGSRVTAGTIIQGADGDPFVTIFDAADGTLSFDGPYGYATRTCAGGQARIATLDPVTLDATSFPNGGQLEFTNGMSTVQVTFNNDGSATFQFEGGAGGTLTADEILDSPGLC